jgi:hypothetical protein
MSSGTGHSGNCRRRYGEVAWALLDLLRCGPALPAHARFSSWRPGQWRELLQLARRQQMRSLLHYRLQQLGLLQIAPPDVRVELRDAYLAATAANLGLYHDVKLITRLLTAHGIPALVLKGAYLARTVYPAIGLREMGDLDLLVPRPQLLDAYDAVSALGYYPNPQDNKGAQERLRSHHHLIGLRKGPHHMVELHWHLEVPVRWPIEEFWQRAVPFEVDGETALALCPEDLLLHLCHHLSYQHRFTFGLRPLLDVVLAVERFGGELDWLAVVERARRLGWYRGVQLTLRLARSLLAAEIPEQVVPEDASPSCQVQEEAAIALLLSPGDWCQVPPGLAQLWQQPVLAGKFSILLRRIFLSREQLNELYSLDGNSLKLYWYYLVRIRDLFRRNSWIFGRRAGLDRLIRHHDQLTDWLKK